MQNHAIPCNIMHYHAISCNTMQYHAIQCNTLHYHIIPCYTMQYHAIPCPINNCWRSIPLPCGQYKAIFTITIITIITLLYHYYQVKDISLCGAILQDCNVTLNPFQFRESSKAGQLMWCQQWDGKGSLLLDSLASKTKRNAFGKTINIQTTKQCPLTILVPELLLLSTSGYLVKPIWMARVAVLP